MYPNNLEEKCSCGMKKSDCDNLEIKDLRVSFTTSVTFRMICLYIWTWIIRGTITHKNVKVEKVITNPIPLTRG